MMRTVLKWLTIGVGFGVGAALALAGIFAAEGWYSSRPKPWNKTAIQATFVRAHVSETDRHLSFAYRLQNATAHDITIEEGDVVALINLVKEETSLQSDNSIKPELPIFIPANHSVLAFIGLPDYKLPTGKEVTEENALQYAQSFKNFDGFTVFVKSLRFEVAMPGANSKK